MPDNLDAEVALETNWMRLQTNVIRKRLGIPQRVYPVRLADGTERPHKRGNVVG